VKEKYRDLLNHAPVAIVELDYRPLLLLQKEVPSGNASEIRSFLLKNPGKLKAAFRLVKVLNINQGALNFYGVSKEEDFFARLIGSFTGRASDVLVEQCVSLFSGEKEFSGEMKCRIGGGQVRDVFLKTVIYHKSSGKGLLSVIMTLQDITAWKKIERHLIKKAQVDGLTNLFNQSAMLDRLEQELVRAKRYGLELSCMMIDLDFFKVINDKFGHQKGDRILKEVSVMIRNCFRKVDVIGRYGGDEFIVLLPETSSKNAYYAAHRLQRIFADRLFKYKNVITFHITLSIGIAGYSVQKKKIKDAQDLIALADNEMYNCKKAGRNRISVASS
jgi:diguanylate cyclase (GGDEF)-like protein